MDVKVCFLYAHVQNQSSHLRNISHCLGFYSLGFPMKKLFLFLCLILWMIVYYCYITQEFNIRSLQILRKLLLLLKSSPCYKFNTFLIMEGAIVP